MDEFMFLIRSSSKELSTQTTNNCTIRLNGLPQQYRLFDATLEALHINTTLTTLNNLGNTSTVELRTDGLNFVNGMDTKNNNLRTVGFASLNQTFPQSEYKFRFENANGKSVSFQLYNDAGGLLQNSGSDYNLPWILILKLQGVE
jgi:hypothetical protein